MKATAAYMFVSQRDIVVTSTLGYSIEFKKGEPTHVPKAMHAEVMEKGITPVEGDLAGEVTDDASPRKLLVASEDADERKEAIVEAIREIAKKNDSKDFTAAGVPTAKAVTAITGWKAEPVEIRTAWADTAEEREEK